MGSAGFDIDAIRAQFPALAQKQVFMDNAGGSQVLGSVIDSIATYLRTTNVQLGASYPVSQQSTSKFSAGHVAGAKYINASPDQVVFGPSTTQHFRNLSTALKTEPGDEIVLSKLDHEANVAGWLQMAKWRGLKVVWWVPSKDTDSNPKLVPEDLRKLVNDKTRLVACTHTSNILGTVTDLAALSEVVHAANPRALFAADAVAYAPHAPVDVQAFGVDFYSFSWYKVYGPHVAMLYVSPRAHPEIETLGHYFKTTSTLEEMLGLAAGSYEAVQAVPEIIAYLSRVGWDAISKQEEQIQEILLKYLRSKPDIIKIYGEPSCDRKLRIPLVSWRVKGQSSLGIIDAIEARSNYGCRNGHFYSKRLCEEVLNVPDADDGVLRCSLLHYNTVEEVEGLVKVLDEVITEGAGKNPQGGEGRNDVSNW
ncbi:cysteine desulfurase [Cyphellophora europaea CBS 101466]|uniref:Cysteine desulfurase n=1 Tax=Cyphellophora europaea (strain CBS 101466) TaxID=1220924 RepID=W2S4R9_CYPE1|nr:cysteine desulfurase [Cyphellophora europaea CBS 101466]ETN42934.1 cysteine desulfurase [Cyphellophora europaea CBS 101466]